MLGLLIAANLEGTASKRRLCLPTSIDFLKQVLKGVLDPKVRDSRCFNKHHTLVVLVAQLLRFLLRYLSSRWVRLNQVELVTDQHYTDVLLCRVEKSTEPILQVLERLTIGDIINDEASESLAVMRNGDRTILFLSCRVPQLSFDSSAVLHCHVLSGKLDANSRPRCLGQLVL